MSHHRRLRRVILESSSSEDEQFNETDHGNKNIAVDDTQNESNTLLRRLRPRCGVGDDVSDGDKKQKDTSNTYGPSKLCTNMSVQSSDDSVDTYVEDSFIVKDDEESQSDSSASDFDSDLEESKLSLKDDNAEIVKNLSTNELSLFLDLYPELRAENESQAFGNVSVTHLSMEENEKENFKAETLRKNCQSSTPLNKNRKNDSFIDDDDASSTSESNSSACDEKRNSMKVVSKKKCQPKISKEYKMHELLPDQKMKLLEKSSQKEVTKSTNGGVKDDESFLLALSPSGPFHEDALRYKRTKFSKIRDELSIKIFSIYRIRCFEGKLDPGMAITWNPRLRLTAGRCRCISDHSASIELSVKVCNTAERVRDTLLHELCHAAVWVIDRIPNGRHGPCWKYWVYKCQKVFPTLPLIERCHNYNIDAKYYYICKECGQIIKRHSKSLDISRKKCGICGGRFELRSSNNKSDLNAQPNKFALFVKSNYASHRHPGTKHSDVMKILSEEFKKTRISADIDAVVDDIVEY